MRYLKSYWESGAWALFITYFSLVRDYNMPFVPAFSWRDKLFHAVAYCLLALLLGIEMSRDKIAGKRYWMLLLLLPISFGGLIELIQHYLCTSRVGDIYDFVANTAGVLIATLICKIIVTK